MAEPTTTITAPAAQPGGNEPINPVAAADVKTFEAPEGYHEFSMDEPGSSPPPPPEDKKEDKGTAAPAPQDTKPAKPAPEAEGDDDLSEFFQKPKPAEAPAKPAEAAKPAAPATTETPSGPKELRAAYESTKAEVATLRKQLADVQSGGEQSKEKDTLIAKLTQERDAAEERLRYANYEQSAEYEQKYVQPIKQAIDDLAEEVAQETITDMESGNEVPISRNDVIRFLNIQTFKEASEQAKRFGPLAEHMMAARGQIHRMNRAAIKAKEDYRTNGKAIEQQRQAETAAAQEKARSVFEETSTRIAQKFEDFRENPEDKEGSELFKKGLDFYDRLARRDGLTQEQRIKMTAVVRAKSAAYDRKVLEVTRLREEVAKLKADNAKLLGSEPGEHRPSSVPLTTPKAGAPDGYVAYGDEVGKLVDPRITPDLV